MKIVKLVSEVLLFVAIIALGYYLYESINKPIQFEKQKNKRYEAVVNRLKLIREIQVAYKNANGKYTGSFDTLIDFAKNGIIKDTRNVGTLTDSMLKEGITEKEAIKLGIIRRDTISISVKDSICKAFNPDSLKFVPYSVDHAVFEMAASSCTSNSGLVIPVFEASVLNKVYLKGLDNQERINMDDEARQLNRFPGLKVGDVTEPNNNAGNWE